MREKEKGKRKKEKKSSSLVLNSVWLRSTKKEATQDVRVGVSLHHLPLVTTHTKNEPGRKPQLYPRASSPRLVVAI